MLFKKIIPASTITFESFLSGVPARDYVFQSTSYDEQIAQAAEMIKEAEYCLIGAGAGLSAAAGAQYGGKFFEDNFGDFQKKYGKGLQFGFVNYTEDAQGLQLGLVNIIKNNKQFLPVFVIFNFCFK